MEEWQQALDRLKREIEVLEQMLEDHPPGISEAERVVHHLETAGDEIASMKYILNPDHHEIDGDEE